MEINRDNQITDGNFLEKINFNETLDLSVPEIQELIANVEKLMWKSPNQIEIPLKHYFSKAVYAREVILPQGALVVGKIHKYQSMTILSKGEVSVMSSDGVFRVKAPYTFVASPGVKRLVYAHEETIWTTVHGTEETDPEKIEQEIIAKNYDEVVHLDTNQSINSEETPCLT